LRVAHALHRPVIQLNASKSATLRAKNRLAKTEFNLAS
jgi:hypothetical protein